VSAPTIKMPSRAARRRDVRDCVAYVDAHFDGAVFSMEVLDAVAAYLDAIARWAPNAVKNVRTLLGQAARGNSAPERVALARQYLLDLI